MSEPQRKPARPLARLAALVAAGAVAGVVGVYVMETRSGNEASAQGASCPASATYAAAVSENARGEVAAIAPLDRPFAMGSLSFTDTDGQPASFADFTGRTMLVNLWATWCAPCRAEMPALDELEREAGGEDFAVVPVSVDMGEDEKPKAFYEEIGLTDLPFFHDGSMALFNDLKREGLAFGLPVTILVDEAGCARAVMNGPAEWASPDALRLIDAVKGASV
ncbi:thiol:disulfide interchange protein TlpA [Aureimonas mangrovi]|uniref:thiol:disulfide interchange protein TlpA n=1 Tax=Aureimonas mangrovi TaxID=2758041 RepID=UPI00163DA6CE|nr:TlpA disulfide reductase family protein [Aureimonas mangrovi]